MNLTHEERQERTDEAWRLKELWTRHRIMDRPPLPAETPRPIALPTPPDYWTRQEQAIKEEGRATQRRISSEIIAELKREGRIP